MFMLATWFDPKPREITVGFRPTDSRSSPDPRRGPKGNISDQVLIELFLDMVAAERRWGQGTR